MTLDLHPSSSLEAAGADSPAAFKSEIHEITSRGQWLDLRRQDVTASRVAALFDCHPFMTREQLAGSLAGTYDQGDSPSMRRGRLMEPGVAIALAEDHPAWRIEKATTYHRLPEHRLGATPDFWLTDENGVEGLIQAKTVSPEAWEQWRGKPPLGYQLQVLCELLVTGRQRGILAVMIMNRGLSTYEWEITRHPAAEAKLLDAAALWWAAWDRGEIAPAVPSGELGALLDDGSTVDLSGDNQLCAWLPERQALKAEIGERERRVTEIDTAIKSAMGKATFGYAPGWTLTFRSHVRAERVMPAATIRTLRVSAAKEEESI